jgi:hypothetical protein
MKPLKEQLFELEIKIDKNQLIAETVSASSVGWHIEHTLLTINLIIGALKRSNAETYQRKFSYARLIVFTMNKIPRGRGRAPKIVVPVIYDDASLKMHIQKAKEKIKELDFIDKNQYFEHPYFGHLKVKQAIKFLKIHTDHHIKIINDIIKNK